MGVKINQVPHHTQPWSNGDIQNSISKATLPTILYFDGTGDWSEFVLEFKTFVHEHEYKGLLAQLQCLRRALKGKAADYLTVIFYVFPQMYDIDELLD